MPILFPPMLHLLAERAEEARHPASPAFVALCVVGVIALATIGRLITHQLDRSRILKYAADQGWQVIDCRWKLFGPGWLGSSRERIYELDYSDREGRTHTAFVKTSALAGVYLTEDRVQA